MRASVAFFRDTLSKPQCLPANVMHGGMGNGTGIALGIQPAPQGGQAVQYFLIWGWGPPKSFKGYLFSSMLSAAANLVKLAKPNIWKIMIYC